MEANDPSPDGKGSARQFPFTVKWMFFVPLWSEKNILKLHPHPPLPPNPQHGGRRQMGGKHTGFYSCYTRTVCLQRWWDKTCLTRAPLYFASPETILHTCSFPIVKKRWSSFPSFSTLGDMVKQNVFRLDLDQKKKHFIINILERKNSKWNTYLISCNFLIYSQLFQTQGVQPSYKRARLSTVVASSIMASI